MCPEACPRTPAFDGLNACGSVEGQEALFTIDTGATSSILSSSIYHSLPADERPTLHTAKDTICTDGHKMTPLGTGAFHVILRPFIWEQEMLVAHIEDKVLLGADVLLAREGGPVDLILSQGFMMIDDVQIPVEQVCAAAQQRRVVAADHHTIPARSANTLVIVRVMLSFTRHLMDRKLGVFWLRPTPVFWGSQLPTPWWT